MQIAADSLSVPWMVLIMRNRGGDCTALGSTLTTAIEWVWNERYGCGSTCCGLCSVWY